MAIPRSAWGIDIGNRALKAIKLVRDGGQLRIGDYEIIEHEQILTNAGDNRESLLQTALANFVQRHETKGVPVSVNVSGQSSFARFIKLPPVEPKKVPEIIRFEAIQQIPFPLDDVEWSYQLFQTPESPEVEVGIFAMRKDLVNRQIAYFTDLGLNVQVVQMNPLAVYNAMYYDDQIRDTTMFMDMGAENTDLIIAEGQTVWLRTLPIGGNNFTEALAKSFKLNFVKAEELKRNAATSKYARQIFQAMRPVFADLVAEVQRSIGFYASVHRDSRIRRIVALGGTFRLPGLQKYLQQNLTLDVERMDRFAAGAPADGKLAASFSENILSLASAYGLAIQALGEAKITSSLLPARIRRIKLWQEKTKWFGAAAALFALGTIGIGGRLYLDNKAYADNAQARADSQQTLTDAMRFSRDWGDVERQGGDDRTRILNIRSLQEYRELWPSILTDIYQAMPKPQADTWDKLKQVPRQKRSQILISSITSRYVTDVDTAGGAAAAIVGGQPSGPMPIYPGGGGPMPIYPGGGGPMPIYPGGGGPMPIYPGGGWGMGGFGPAGGGAGQVTATPPSLPNRGFIVTVRGVTPNAGGVSFVEQTLVAALKKVTASAALAANKPYYVADATLVSSAPRAVDPRMQRQDPEVAAIDAPEVEQSGAAGAFPRVFPGGAMMPGGNNPNAVDPTLDPFTGEPMDKDWEFEYRVVIRLDPAAATAATSSGATGPKPAGK